MLLRELFLLAYDDDEAFKIACRLTDIDKAIGLL